MEARTTMEKLQVLLPHWVEHNRSHGAEFAKWAAAARAEGAGALADRLDAAAKHIAAADEILVKAQVELGGPAGGHDHPHGHSHHGEGRHHHGPG